jgi:carboxylate-amine ligase
VTDGPNQRTRLAVAVDDPDAGKRRFSARAGLAPDRRDRPGTSCPWATAVLSIPWAGIMVRMRTIGVEEELLIVDRTGEGLRPLAGEILGIAGRRPADPSGHGTAPITSEFKLEQIEVLTQPCTELAELLAEVRAARTRVDASASSLGARVAALATSPFPGESHLSGSARFEKMMDDYALTAREQLTCGLHVHVGIESADEGVAVMDRLRVWLPVLAALSANSPLWQGSDSGFASYRSQAWSRWPTAGPTPLLGSAEAYRTLLRDLLETGVPLDEGMMYFDVRLSQTHPTIEIRVADVCLHAADSVMLAGLVRGLVETASGEWKQGRPPPPVSDAVLRLAAWRASRSGINGALLDPATHLPVPAGQAIEALLQHVSPALRAADDHGWIQSALETVRMRGTGERHQRAVLGRTGSLSKVALEAVRVTTGS